MEDVSRVKKSLLNARVNLIFYFLALILSFFSRKIFLDSLGADFVGLTTTLQNLLGFLSLAELGVGTAIAYVLYKPLYDKDEQKINEIVSVLGFLYQRVGLVILSGGVILSAFLPLIFPRTGFEMTLIFFAFYSFLTTSIITYFLNYKQLLLSADQKNYVVTAYFQSATILKTIIQMALAYYTRNYYLWVAVELIFGFIFSLILNWKINQVYPWLRSELKQGRAIFKKYPEIWKYAKQLFIHQINEFIQFQTSPLFIYSFVSLKIVAYYGNYLLVSDKLAQILEHVGGSTRASIGNLIAEGNIPKIESIFWELNVMEFFVAGFFAFGLYQYTEPFIALWLGKEYLLAKSTLLFIILNLSIRIIQGSMQPFLYGFGLFQDIWASVLQTIIFITLSIIGGYNWGLNGILLGGTTAYGLIYLFWKPYFLYKQGFKISVLAYWKKWGLNLSIIAVTLFISAKIYKYVLSMVDIAPYNSFGELLLAAFIGMSVCTVITFASFYLLNESMRAFVKRFIRF